MKTKKIIHKNSDVKLVSDFLQEFMIRKSINQMTADECADVLANNNILSNKVGPKPGFNFRQMLREGRDGKIMLVDGANQIRPHTKWYIKRLK